MDFTLQSLIRQHKSSPDDSDIKNRLLNCFLQQSTKVELEIFLLFRQSMWRAEELLSIYLSLDVAKKALDNKLPELISETQYSVTQIKLQGRDYDLDNELGERLHAVRLDQFTAEAGDVTDFLFIRRKILNE